MATRSFPAASMLLAGALLPACSALPRLEAVPPELTERAAIPGIPDARVWLDRDLGPFIATVIQDTNREVKALRNAGKPTDPLPPAYALAISGGGDAGAFAAGILCGWTAHGDRPEFKVVTGISVGALIAPFAFLGPQYDDVLRSVATSTGSADVLLERLRMRQTESPQELADRLQSALQELQSVDEYEYVVVNDNLDVAVKRIGSIIDAEVSSRQRVVGLRTQVALLIDQLEREIESRTNNEGTRK